MALSFKIGLRMEDDVLEYVLSLFRIYLPFRHGLDWTFVLI